MKINNLLEGNEQVYDEIRETPFFKQFGYMLYRGAMSPDDKLYPFAMRKGSKDTWAPIHNTINTRSEEKVGVPVRNLLFASVSSSQASTYGTLTNVYPNGKNFRLFISTGINDMTNIVGGYTHDVKNKFKNLINDTIPMYLSLSPDVFTRDAETKDHFIGCFQQWITYTDREAFDLAGAMAYIRANLKDEILALFEKEDITVSNFETLYEKAFEEFYEDNFAENIEKYIDNLTEVDTPEELKEHNGEVMVYSPDGVYSIDHTNVQWELAS